MAGPAPQPTTSPQSLEDDLALVEVGPGRFEAHITRRWWIVIGPNGGLSAALLLEAAQLGAGRDDLHPRALHVQYLSAPTEGPATLEVTVDRSGRQAAFVSVVMRQGERATSQARVVLVGPQDTAFDADYGAMPVVPTVGDCPRFEAPEARPVASYARLDRRTAFPAPDGPSSAPVGGWLRLTPGEAVDAVRLALYTDNWPPSAREQLGDQRLHTITLDLSVYFRTTRIDVGPDQHCLVVLHPQGTGEGIHQEDAEVWSPDGRILATARQLALVFLPDHA
jgi:acyl-CoA thioesterase